NRLMVEQEFLGINKRPDNVFVGALGVFAVLFNVSERDRHFVGLWFAGESQQIQLTQFGLMLARLIGAHQGGATIASRELTLNFARVKQMQALGQVGFRRALAFARAAGFGLAKYRQEVRVKAVIG